MSSAPARTCSASAGSRVADGDLDGGVAVVERGEGALHHRGGLTGAADHAEPEPPGDHSGQLGQFGAGDVELVQHGAGAVKQQFTRRGEAHRPAGALEQGDPCSRSSRAIW